MKVVKCIFTTFTFLHFGNTRAVCVEEYGVDGLCFVKQLLFKEGEKFGHMFIDFSEKRRYAKIFVCVCVCVCVHKTSTWTYCIEKGVDVSTPFTFCAFLLS